MSLFLGIGGVIFERRSDIFSRSGLS